MLLTLYQKASIRLLIKSIKQKSYQVLPPQFSDYMSGPSQRQPAR
jgi:hypothetical protein